MESLSESNLLDDIDSLHISNSGNNVGDKNENLSCTMVLNNKQSVDEMDEMFKFVPKDSDGVDLFADNNSTKTATTSSKLSTNDLWSNFTSCNTSNTTTNNPITSQSKTITETFMSSTNDDNDSITANQFDDWAKF